MRYLCAIILLLTLPGCALVESKRWGQDKVREPVRDVVSEDIKAASKYLDRELTPENAPAQTDAVADALSDRVGPPETLPESAEGVIRELGQGRADLESDRRELDRWLEKRAGYELENTGWSILGIGGFILGAGIIAICFVLPGGTWLVVFVMRKLAGTSRGVALGAVQSIRAGVDEWSQLYPEAAPGLKNILSRTMDAPQKDLIRKSRKGRL